MSYLQKKYKNEASLQNFLKHVSDFSHMDEETILQYIQRRLYVRDKPQLFSDFLLMWRRKNYPPLNHPFTPRVSGLLAEYVRDVHQALCADGWLCALVNQRYEEQVDKISDRIENHTSLERWHLRKSSIPFAVLITKAGIVEFCCCSKSNEC